MKYRCEALAAIGELEERICSLRQEAEAQIETFVATKIRAGWQKFVFSSGYYGSHTEYGETDIVRTFLFCPEIDISRWDGVEFSHGHSGRSEANSAFDSWLELLELLSDSQFIEVLQR